MNTFTREPCRTDVTPLRTRTPAQQAAAEAREEREWEAHQRAYLAYHRSLMPWPLRIIAGLIDVARGFARGTR